MDALTRLRRSLVGGGDEEEDLPEDSILGDTEDLCSLSQLQVKRIPSETPECRMDFIMALLQFASIWLALRHLPAPEDLRVRGVLGGRTRPDDPGTLPQFIASAVLRELYIVAGLLALQVEN